MRVFRVARYSEQEQARRGADANKPGRGSERATDTARSPALAWGAAARSARTW